MLSSDVHSLYISTNFEFDFKFLAVLEDDSILLVIFQEVFYIKHNVRWHLQFSNFEFGNFIKCGNQSGLR